MSHEALAGVVLPVFCFIALGYLVVTIRLVTAQTGDAVASFVFNVVIPFLLFRAIGTMELPPIAPWPFWLTYFACAAVNLALGTLIIRRVFGRDARAGVIAGLCASYSNVVMVGLPVTATAFGEEGLVTILLLVAVHLPVMMAVSAILIEIVEARGQPGRANVLAALWRVALGFVRNPLILAVAAGLAFRLSGLSLTGIAQTVTDRVSDMAIPLALISLGMSLHKYGVKGNVVPAAVLGLVKLLLMPALAYVLAKHVVGLPPLGVAVVVVSAACPTGANAYLIANRFQTGLALSANAITLTTAASVLSMGLWLWLVT